MQHPQLVKLRARSEAARARARAVLDADRGVLDVPVPQVATSAEHEALELDARQQVRDILSSLHVAQRLNDIEQVGRLARRDQSGLALPDEVATVVWDAETEELLTLLLGELHYAATLVDVLQRTPVPTPDPTVQALWTIGLDPGVSGAHTVVVTDGVVESVTPVEPVAPE